jgi:hypothetical protein
MHTVPLTPRLSAHVLSGGAAARIRLEGRLELAAIHPLIALLVGDRWQAAILDVTDVAATGDVALATLVSELEALWVPRVRVVGLGADEKRLLRTMHVGRSVVA